MAKLAWDQTGQKTYETGVSQGVLYPIDEDGKYPKGIAWNGLTNVAEKPSGAEASPIWADNQKYLNLVAAEEFGATIQAYTYPDEFAECDGSKEIAPGVYAGQQARKTFGMSYKTIIGNDTNGESHGYKIHLIYGALASPSEKAYATINDNPDAIQFSWDVKTTPVPVTGAKATSCLTIDSTKTTSEKMAKLEAIIYGTDDKEAYLPLPDEVVELFKDVVPGP